MLSKAVQTRQLIRSHDRSLSGLLRLVRKHGFWGIFQVCNMCSDRNILQQFAREAGMSMLTGIESGACLRKDVGGVRSYNSLSFELRVRFCHVNQRLRRTKHLSFDLDRDLSAQIEP